MRRVAAILIVSVCAGCAANRSARRAEPAPVAQRAQPAAALAFDAPVGYGLPDEAVARAARHETAYVGFDDTIVTYSYIRTDDRQYIFDGSNDFDRRALTARVGISYR